MNFRQALPSDLAEIESLLKASQLPYLDCSSHLQNFVVLHDQNKIYGTAAAEIYDNVALLRSVAIDKHQRGKGLGASIFFRIKDHLQSSKIKAIYLLTEMAEDYFKQFGFEVISRELAPKSIKQTAQFSTLCPSSAVVMKLDI